MPVSRRHAVTTSIETDTYLPHPPEKVWLRRHWSVPTSRPADEFRASKGDGVEGAPDGVRDVRVGSDDGQEVGETEWGLADVGGPDVHVAHAGCEHDESAPTWQCGRGSEQAAEAGSRGLLSDGLGEDVVVIDKLVLGHAQGSADARRGEVADFEVIEVGGADPAEHLEGVNSVVEEVAEHRGPCWLFLV